MEFFNLIYKDFIVNYKIVLKFIFDNFGEKEILTQKNRGLIQSKNLEIKNSQIKGYVFHGSGCDFKFKNNNIDIEFEKDSIGFLDWSLYLYAKKINPNISEEFVKGFLKEKVNAKELKFNNNIYELLE